MNETWHWSVEYNRHQYNWSYCELFTLEFIIGLNCSLTVTTITGRIGPLQIDFKTGFFFFSLNQNYVGLDRNCWYFLGEVLKGVQKELACQFIKLFLILLWNSLPRIKYTSCSSCQESIYLQILVYKDWVAFSYLKLILKLACGFGFFGAFFALYLLGDGHTPGKYLWKGIMCTL